MKNTASILQVAFKVATYDLIMEIVMFPIFWYGKGLLAFLKLLLNYLKDMYNRLAIDVWSKNFFVPMFGQYDIPGRLISVFLRLVQILFRSMVLLIWILILSGAFFVYMTILPVILFFIILNLNLIKL